MSLIRKQGSRRKRQRVKVRMAKSELVCREAQLDRARESNPTEQDESDHES